MATQFSQKHYIAIAKVLNDQIEASKEQSANARYQTEIWRHTHDRKAVRGVAVSLAALFKADNPKFDEDRFLKAAGVR